MAHIAIDEGIPGILGPMKFRSETTNAIWIEHRGRYMDVLKIVVDVC
jgi:hypothetical protein